MKITVIIPSLASTETKPHLELCVKSLRATVDWDIIVVTNGTKAPEPLNIPGITTRLHTRDQGQCNAVNIGASAATPNTDYLFIVNDDMYFAPDWNLKLELDDYMSPCSSPNLVEPTNNNGSAVPFLKFNGGFTLEEFKRAKVDKFIKDTVSKPAHITGMGVGVYWDNLESGFNFPVFIKKDLWDLLGGYDTAYDPWGSGSDTDLQMKVELAGARPMRLRDVLVYHFSNKSGTFDGTHQDYWQNNWDYLQDKWGFNRDDADSDTWYCRNMIMWDRLKYYPAWKGKYADKIPESEN